MGKRPEASVVIPTHNRWPRLELALRSALGQQDVEHEVIVVDDGSSDETPERLSALEDARLHVIRHDRPQGVARARNRGLAAARGDWIAFLDDDDVWSPRKLRAQLDAAGEAGVVYGTYLAVDASLRPIRIAPPPSAAEFRRRILRTNPVGGPSTFIVRADALAAAGGGFDEELSAFADWDLLVRLAAHTNAVPCSDVVVGYVEHGQNMMAGDPERLRGEFDLLAAKHRAVAAEAGVEFGDLWLLGWEARAARRAGKRLRAAALYGRRALRGRRRADLGRLVAALFGEETSQRGRRAAGRLAPEPEWLSAYRSAAAARSQSSVT